MKQKDSLIQEVISLMQLVSGSIYGGVSSNKITAIAGESSTGKTYFSLGCCQKLFG